MVVHYLLVPRCQNLHLWFQRRHSMSTRRRRDQSEQQKMMNMHRIHRFPLLLKVENNDNQGSRGRNPMDFLKTTTKTPWILDFSERLHKGGQCYWPSLPTEETFEAGKQCGEPNLRCGSVCFWWWNLNFFRRCIFQDIGQSLKLSLFWIYWLVRPIDVHCANSGFTDWFSKAGGEFPGHWRRVFLISH